MRGFHSLTGRVTRVVLHIFGLSIGVELTVHLSGFAGDQEWYLSSVWGGFKDLEQLKKSNIFFEANAPAEAAEAHCLDFLRDGMRAKYGMSDPMKPRKLIDQTLAQKSTADMGSALRSSNVSTNASAGNTSTSRAQLGKVIKSKRRPSNTLSTSYSSSYSSSTSDSRPRRRSRGRRDTCQRRRHRHRRKYHRKHRSKRYKTTGGRDELRTKGESREHDKVEMSRGKNSF
ncbi:hypothetical protein AAMO2058_001387500 [Amorphochlora amoebiformis]